MAYITTTLSLKAIFVHTHIPNGNTSEHIDCTTQLNYESRIIEWPISKSQTFIFIRHDLNYQCRNIWNDMNTHAHAHASFILITTKPLPNSATNTDYDWANVLSDGIDTQ